MFWDVIVRISELDNLYGVVHEMGIARSVMSAFGISRFGGRRDREVVDWDRLWRGRYLNDFIVHDHLLVGRRL
jgi:hypothetical protein